MCEYTYKNTTGYVISFFAEDECSAQSQLKDHVRNTEYDYYDFELVEVVVD